MEILKKYFPNLSPQQIQQFASLYALYSDWNAKINVISRKDIENLYIHHVLHSLGIAKMISFTSESEIMDVGTGGGFPGIPLAIFFPECKFHLLDRIRKKITVATEIAKTIGLENVSFRHCGVEEEAKNIKQEQKNAFPNGLICLKGGELQAEIAPVKRRTIVYDLKDYFDEEFFVTKKIVYVQI